MKQSETLLKLFEALSKAQGEMQNATKSKYNPFHKSKYADLGAVWDAIRACLSKNGLCVTQLWETVDSKNVLTTILGHSSGEFIWMEVIVKPVKDDPQGIGSALTYYRRFALSAIIGNAPEEKVTQDDVDESKDDVDDSDDDANAASGKIINTKGIPSSRDLYPNKPIFISPWKFGEKELTQLKQICTSVKWTGEMMREECRILFDATETQINEEQFKKLCHSIASKSLQSMVQTLETHPDFEKAVNETPDPRMVK